MIKISDILELFRDTLHDDATLNAWTTANLGADPTIYVGIDAQNPPGIDDTPFVTLTPEANQEGQEVNFFNYSVVVNWAINNGAKTESGRKVTYDGFLVIDDFGEQIWTSLTGASNSIALSERTFAVEAIEFWPLLVGQMSIRINVPQLIGTAQVGL